jgi:AcrR family transcriptional regulator
VTSAERTRLTKATVVEKALALADADGPEALTIRRLADQLGVTPMAIYWHFKNKDELFAALADHVMSEVVPTVEPDAAWHEQLRSMVSALIRVIRQHPSGPAVLFTAEKMHVPGFTRATEAVLALLRRAGFDLREGFDIAVYLLHNSMKLVEHEPGRMPGMSPPEAAEWMRLGRLTMQALPADQYPNMVEFAGVADVPDLDAYYEFGLDLMMAGIRALAATRTPSDHLPGGAAR